MKDPELNKALALIIHPIEKLRFYESGRIRVVLGELIDAHDIDAFGCAKYLDYCNNWSDLMPLVVEYMAIRKVYTNIDGRVVCSLPIIDGVTVIADNQQRALAECLLKVLEATEKDLKTAKDIKVFYGPMARYPYLY